MPSCIFNMLFMPVSFDRWSASVKVESISTKIFFIFRYLFEHDQCGSAHSFWAYTLTSSSHALLLPLFKYQYWCFKNGWWWRDIDRYVDSIGRSRFSFLFFRICTGRFNPVHPWINRMDCCWCQHGSSRTNRLAKSSSKQSSARDESTPVFELPSLYSCDKYCCESNLN